MEHADLSPPDPGAFYDVLLADRPPQSLLDRFPDVPVRTTAVQTELRRRLGDPSELDVLLEKLVSIGVPLVEIHSSAAGRGETTYEVRVAGEVGEPVLCYLDWPHRVVPSQTRVRIGSPRAELHHFLLACTELGATIQRVLRLDPAPQRPRMRA